MTANKAKSIAINDANLKARLRQIEFRWQEYSWQINLRKQRVASVLRSHAGAVVRWSLALAGLIAGIALVVLNVTPTPGQLSVYLVSVAAMIGGTTAIIFSISILPMQGSSDISFSRYLEDYTGDWRYQQGIYALVILITLAFFGDALYLANASTSLNPIVIRVMVLLSPTFIGVVFALIDKQYEIVRRKLSPRDVIKFLNSRGLRLVANLERDVKRRASLMQFKAPVRDDAAVALAYGMLNTPVFAELHGLVETLAEFSLKLSARHEVENAISALKAVGDILASYIHNRRSSSQRSWSQVVPMALESDSHALLAPSLERLNDVSLQASRDGDEAVTVGLITEVYPSLLNAASQITYLPETGNDNPIFDLMTTSLSIHSRECATLGREDSVLRSTYILGDAIITAISNGRELSVFHLFEQIEPFIGFGILLRSVAIIDSCVDNYHKVLTALLTGDSIERRMHIKKALNGISAATAVLSNGTKTDAFPVPTVAAFSIPKGYRGLEVILMQGMTYFGSLKDERLRVAYRLDLLGLLEDLRSSIRGTSKALGDAEGMFANAVGATIMTIAGFIQTALRDDSFDDIREKLVHCWTTFCYLPYFIISDANVISRWSVNLDTMINSITVTGIAAADLREPSALVASIRGIFAAAGQVLEKTDDSSGTLEPRMLLSAAYLGVLANKLGFSQAVAEYVKQIAEFEPKYRLRYLTTLPPGLPPDFDINTHNIVGLPHPDEPLREIRRWKDNFEFERLNGVHFRPESDIYKRVSEADIDAFIVTVWPAIGR